MTDAPDKPPKPIPTVPTAARPTDSEDLAPTVPAAGWDAAATIAAPGRAPQPLPATMVPPSQSAATRLHAVPTGAPGSTAADAPTMNMPGWAEDAAAAAKLAGQGQDPTMLKATGLGAGTRQVQETVMTDLAGATAFTQPAQPTHTADPLAATRATEVARNGVQGATVVTAALSHQSTNAATLQLGTNTGGNSGTNLTGTGTSQSFTRTGRTRINLNLPAEARQLDEKLQLSRTSVLSDMASTRLGRGEALPPGIKKLIEDQGTEGRYAITKPLAAGGMGAVLAIQDHDFRRHAAMKVIKGSLASNAEVVERFLAEAQVTAQLEHPNIVPIHDLGVMEDGTLYFTMKLIEGESLGHVVKQLKAHDAQAVARWSDEEKILTFLKVLDGVGFAHSRGVIHRDIKPDNIMLGAHGEVLVVDWGIAKVLSKADPTSELVRQVASVREHQSLSQTIEGMAMGTAYYMPPEQAQGKLDEIDARSDVYALGATLYELISTKRCLDSTNLAQMLMKVVDGDIIPLSIAKPGVNPDLAAIVHHAMATRREGRYASCAEFSADLRLYLAGQAVIARKRNLIERIGQWYSVHKRQVQVGAAMAVILLIAVMGTVAVLKHRNRAIVTEAIAQVQLLLAPAHAAESYDANSKANNILASVKLIENPPRPELAKLIWQVDNTLKTLAATHEAQLAREARISSANGLLQDAITKESQGDFPSAEKLLNSALGLTPDNKDIQDNLVKVVHAIAQIQDQKVYQQAMLEVTQAGDLLHQAQALDKADPHIIRLLNETDRLLDVAQRSGAVIPAIAERIKASTQLGDEAARARTLAHSKVSAAEAVVMARTQLSAGNYELAKTAIAQALGFVPGEPQADQLRQEILEKERIANEAAQLADRKQKCAHAIEVARQALQAGDVPAAADAVARALGYMPGDVSAQALHDQVFEAQRQVQRNAELAQARVKAAHAFATAREELDQRNQAIQRLATDVALRDKLTAKLNDRSGSEKQPLWDAKRAVQTEEGLVTQHWSLTEAAAQNVLGFLAEQPADPLVAQAKGLLAGLYQERLVTAMAKRDVNGTATYANLLRRYDDGRYAALLSGQGHLRISGQAGQTVSIVRLDTGADLRLVPVGTSRVITLPSHEIALPAGSYQLSAGDILISLVVTAAKVAAIEWPASVPAIPGMPLRYVPSIEGTTAFMLGTYEVTHDQYHRFVLDPAIFAKVQESWTRCSAANIRDEDPPLLYIPRKAPHGSALDPWEPVSKAGVLSELRMDPAIRQTPVSGISRVDAQAYCEWLSKQSGLRVRLPTAAEWQFAANGGDVRRVYPWGEDFDSALTINAYLPNANGAVRQFAAKVGSAPTDVGPFGNFDMAGNVREWLGGEGKAMGAQGALVAGGSWSDDRASQFMATATESVPPDYVGASIGFRVLVELP